MGQKPPARSLCLGKHLRRSAQAVQDATVPKVTPMAAERVLRDSEAGRRRAVRITGVLDRLLQPQGVPGRHCLPDVWLRGDPCKYSDASSKQRFRTIHGQTNVRREGEGGELQVWVDQNILSEGFSRNKIIFRSTWTRTADRDTLPRVFYRYPARTNPNLLAISHLCHSS